MTQGYGENKGHFTTKAMTRLQFLESISFK